MPRLKDPILPEVGQIRQDPRRPARTVKVLEVGQICYSTIKTLTKGGQTSRIESSTLALWPLITTPEPPCQS